MVNDILIRDAKLKFRWMLTPRKETKEVILHHAAGLGSVETVHYGHQNRGWNGIAYNYYVRLNGEIWKGRGLTVMGGHDGDAHNRISVGICAEGNFCNIEMPEVQKAAIVDILAYVLAHYPNCTVYRHCDVNPTACPGYNYPFEDIVNGARNMLKECGEMGEFADIQEHWAKENIEKCFKLGLLKGKNDGLFYPDENITRAEVATVISRLVDLLPNGIEE